MVFAELTKLAYQKEKIFPDKFKTFWYSKTPSIRTYILRICYGKTTYSLPKICFSKHENLHVLETACIYLHRTICHIKEIVQAYMKNLDSYSRGFTIAQAIFIIS